MLQNKIYQEFFIRDNQNVCYHCFGLSLIALTVRAVNFLDLIVDSGYPLKIYFLYSFFKFIWSRTQIYTFSFYYIFNNIYYKTY